MRTATITFHASHNYGSMLQAFALQKMINRLGHDNEVLNLRTDRQKWLYPKPDELLSRKDVKVKKFIRRMLYFPFVKDLQIKHELFESFLQKDLKLSRVYSNLQELNNADLPYDCFIAGGDQIWNTSPLDFDWSFYLPFVKAGRKISYAVSMGPHAEEQVTSLERIRKYLSSFDAISVREKGTKDLVSSLTDVPVVESLDPTLLLDKSEWESFINSRATVKGDYIFVYSPSFNPVVYDIADKLGQLLKKKVVTSIYHPRMLQYSSLKYELAVGPWEFLDILSKADLVVSGSFHAVVFSVIFNKPFWAINGAKDNRMRTFLENTHLLHRSIDKANLGKKVRGNIPCEFCDAEEFIQKGRIESMSYLSKAIEGKI